MNDFTILIYLIFFVALFGATFAYMWKMMATTLSEFNKTPTNSYSDAMRPYKVPAPHPEMEGVKYGEELMIFNPDDFEEDDDDGDIVVRT
tara:strand:+ start:165 stop:434 length:270 start_codon:yes stop_codon:yes gene_type:complete